MAITNVTANNTRVNNADAITDWLGIGGGQGASAEPSFPYQGTNLVNRKVTSSTGAGMYYSAGFTNMTNASTNTWLVKAIVTDYGGLQTANGLRIRIGSGTGAYYEYVIAGTNSPIGAYSEYPQTGGFVFIPINPSVAGYRTATSGSPVLTSVDYWGCLGAFTASTSKSENLGLDAIDVGTGLTLTGGDGADPDGTFKDFVDTDQGVTTNRWGYATIRNDIISFFGMMTIGSATATVFSDSENSVIFPDGFFDSGYSGVTSNLSNATTNITISNTISGLGGDTVVDTRPDHIVTGTSGSYTFNGQLVNHRNVAFTSACTINGGSIEAKSLSQGDALISNVNLTTINASGSGFLSDINDANISNVIFTQGADGHAIEITSPGTYTLNQIQFDGYGADGSLSASVYNNSGGAVTLSILGGDTPTFRNGTGASTTVLNNKNLTLNGLKNNTEVRVYESGTSNEIAGQELITTGTFTAGIGVNSVDIVIHALGFINQKIEGLDMTADVTLPIQQNVDRQYLNL